MLVLCILTFTPLEEIALKKGLQGNKTVEFPLYSAVGSYIKTPSETIFDDDEFWGILTYLQENSITAPLVSNNMSSGYYYWYRPLIGDKNYSDKEFSDLKNDKMPFRFTIERDCKISKERKIYIEKNYKLLFENEYASIYSK